MTNKLKNSVDPLNWRVPITNADGTPTNEFMRKWGQQAITNGSVPDLVTGQVLHYVLAASLSGTGAPPLFRLLAVADIPSLLTLYDAAGAAATAQSNAETFATAAVAAIPAASATAFGLAKVDGTTITAAGGVISAVGGGSSGALASILDDGTNLYLAMQDTGGQLILDVSGDPIYVLEVLPTSAIPALPYASDPFALAVSFIGL